MDIGKQIKKARQNKGLKQIFVADKVGVTPEHLSSVERGVNNPSKSLVKLLEHVLETQLK